MQEIHEQRGLKIMSVENLKIIELAKSIKTWSQVLRASINLLDDELSDDTVSLQLDIDKGNFSRILKGQSNFPIEKLIKFCRIVGHDLPLHWLAYQGGYELRIIPKTLEEQIAKKDEEIERLKQEITTMKGLFKDLVEKKGE